MSVTMKDVRTQLEPDEPDYAKAAQLGADAIPYLKELVNGPDTMLASKAAYLAVLSRLTIPSPFWRTQQAVQNQ